MDSTYSQNKISEASTAEGAVRRSAVPVWKDRELSSELQGVKQRQHGVDVPFFILTMLILTFGVVMVFSASYARLFYYSGDPMRLFTRQLIFAVSGVAIMVLVSRFSVKVFSRWSMMLLLVALLMLAIVPLAGKEVNGAKRWLGVGDTSGGGFTFQPSEIAKLAVIMAYARMITSFGNSRMSTFKTGILPFGAITVLIVALLILEPHISASIIIIALTAIMLFAGGAQLRWFAVAGAALAILLGIVVLLTLSALNKQEEIQEGQESIQSVISDRTENMGYAGKRISAWLNPDNNPLSSGYQIRQSLFAVGSGGVLGLGLGQSRQKLLYLPEEHNDYIFAIVCEELGFVGATLILLLFALLIIRGFWIAIHAKNRYSSLITIGITSLLAIQVFLNIGVVINLIPATGISLPFFSYGGTALWIQMVEMGIVLSVSREIPSEKTERAEHTERTKRTARAERIEQAGHAEQTERAEV